MLTFILVKALLVFMSILGTVVVFHKVWEMGAHDRLDPIIGWLLLSLSACLLILAIGALLIPYDDSKSPSEDTHAILTYTDYNGTQHTEPAAKDISVGKNNVLHYVDMMGHSVDVTIKGYQVSDK